jgi:hypothetical protein
MQQQMNLEIEHMQDHHETEVRRLKGIIERLQRDKM